MLQQSSQQRNRGGAHARIQSTSSKASSAVGDAPKSASGPTHAPGNDRLRDLVNSSETLSESGLYNGLSNTSSGNGSPVRPADTPIPPVGFPPRPAQYARDRSGAGWLEERPSESTPNQEARTQNFDPPHRSLVYPNGKSADYNVWMGNGSEDILSEQTVKAGHAAKASVQIETQTAQTTCSSSLKQKSSLHVLSQLFLGIMEKRKTSGRLTAASTFKPPPRVSLTNTKREVWLSDLANPAVPARRFSRTIPYGINGKGLLEQCLAKEIPTARAIWLTKCIGANELRTLKRKGASAASGTSAEQKWVREWTMHVEQFVEATLSAQSDSLSGRRIRYVVRLTFELFVEQMLDQDHILDWILNSFERSSQEHMMLWLVHTKLYSRFLVRSRKHGRRLADIVCGHISKICTDFGNADLLRPLTVQLHALLTALASSYKECLVFPKSWTKHESIIKSFAVQRGLAASITNIVERNNRMSKPLWDQSLQNTSSPRRRAIILLDKASLDVSISTICASLQEILSSMESSAKLVLEWCSTGYRQGLHRTHLAFRILQHFGSTGADLGDYVLAFMLNPPSNSNLDFLNVIRVVAELVRAKSFAVLKILRAVIARGAMSDSEHNPQAASRLRQLVRNIPTAGLPQHVVHLQRNLLREASAQSSVLGPVQIIKQQIAQSLFSQAALPWMKEEKDTLPNLTFPEIFDISAQLRQAILIASKSAQPTTSMSTPIGQPRLGSHMFCVARDVLEKLGDLLLLADVVGLGLRQDDLTIITHAIDTLQYNALSFAALGALRPLSSHAIERYYTLRNEHSLERPYLSALLGLVETIEGDKSLMQQLSYDLAKCDQRNAMAICSPASDNALDLTSTHMLESEEDLERVLSSGTTMDEQSVVRVFQRLTGHTIASSKANVRPDLFVRLRMFDEVIFDTQMAEWLTQLLPRTSTAVAMSILPALLGRGAVTFGTVARVIETMSATQAMERDSRVKLALVLADLFLSPRAGSGDTILNDQYQFKLTQHRQMVTNGAAVFKCVRDAALLLDDTQATPHMQALAARLQSDETRMFLMQIDSSTGQMRLEAFADAILSGPAPAASALQLVQSMVSKAMHASSGTSVTNMPLNEKVPYLVRTVNELSLPVYRTEIQLALKKQPQATDNSNDMISSLFEAVTRGPESDRPPWLDLMSGLDTSLLQRLRGIAELQALKLINDVLVRIKADGPELDQAQIFKIRYALRRFLYVVDCTLPKTSGSTNDDASSEVENPIHDRFSNIRELLLKHFGPECSISLINRKSPGLTCYLLDGILHLLVVRKLVYERQKVNPSDAASILPILFTMLVYGGFEVSKRTIEFLSDTAAYLSDDLTEDLRASLARTETARFPNDPHVAFIVGPVWNIDTWLGLVTTNHLSSQPTLAATAVQLPAARTVAQQHGNPRFSGPPGRSPTPQKQASIHPQPKSFNPPVPFHLRRWELLPDQGNSTNVNDTAISLSLVGARRV